MKKLILTILALAVFSTIYAQKDLLQSGPMVGYSTMKEVLLWVQTNKEAKVHFEYWNTIDPSIKYKTEQVITSRSKAYIARALADKLEPDNHYNYALFINNIKVERPYKLSFESQPLWLWRSDAPDYSFATGSCTYVSEEKYDRPGKPYGGDYQIFDAIYKKEPNFMLWLGDNVYLREADWNSKTGIAYRYTHTRSLPEMQPMLGSMHHYAIWDDHDYGPNDSDRSYHLKRETEKVFKLFFTNPNYIFDEGTTGFFQWADSEFFLLDNRYWRTPNKRSDLDKHQILGNKQIEWLIDALKNSYAPFKFVVMGGQFLNPLERNEIYANLAPEEKYKILKAIEELKINGVIFLTGDVHHTELTKLDLDGGYPLYDLTVSPITSGVYGKNAEDNPLQVAGTLVKERNYSLIKVFGSKKERTLEISIYNSNGKKLWVKEIKAKSLKFK
ncbi:MAG: alkaline phosphatase D family protein [Bacteroidota bacterium]